MKRIRIVLGLVLWCAIGVVAWRWAAAPRDQGDDSLARTIAPQLWRYASGERRTAELRFAQETPIAAGDPIFVVDGPNTFRQIGEVRLASSNSADSGAANAARLSALLYPTAPQLGDGAKLTYYRTPDSAEWVLKTMLPPHKREQIGEEIRTAFEEHHEEILNALRPIAERSMHDALLVLEEDLPAAIENHSDEFQQLGGKYQRDVVEKEIVPLVKSEIWPIVRRRAEPTADRVGREIWQRVSLWRFGWRYAYDKLPLTEQRLVEQEWRRFLNQEAIPVLQSHTDEMIRVQQRILADVAKNDEVRAAARRSLSHMLEDPELQQLVWEVVQESMIDNPRIREVLHRHWTSPEAQDALRLASSRLEPTVQRIGALVLGTPEEGVTPELARVLRSQVLGKDKRWLVLDAGLPSADDENPAQSRALLVERGEDDPVSPFVRASGASVVMAGQQRRPYGSMAAD